MKIAFLADIHGNYFALKRVLHQLKKEKIKHIYFLGDYVNYFYEPKKCIEKIIESKGVCIRGNHEDILLKIKSKKIKKQKYKDLLGKSLDISLKLQPKYINFLKKMPKKKVISLNGEKFLLAHGSPWDNNFYCYKNNFNKWKKKILKYKYKVIILAHTHIQMEKNYKNIKILNVGSVGQPRDGTKTAHFMTYNTKTKTFKFQKLKYDRTKLSKQIEKNGI